MFFVALAPVSDPVLVMPAIAQALGVRETGSQGVIQGVKLALQQKHVLLLLDNFERVLEAVPQIVDLLKACPLVKVLATSRSPWRVRGEQELPVPALAVPDAGAGHDLARLATSPSMELFVPRARQIKPDLALTARNAGAVAAISRRLDGLPLVDKSLLVQTDEEGEPRFCILPTIREFALGQLAESEEEKTLRRQHARYCLAVAEHHAAHMRGPEHMQRSRAYAKAGPHGASTITTARPWPGALPRLVRRRWLPRSSQRCGGSGCSAATGRSSAGGPGSPGHAGRFHVPPAVGAGALCRRSAGLGQR